LKPNKWDKHPTMPTYKPGVYLVSENAFDSIQNKLFCGDFKSKFLSDERNRWVLYTGKGAMDVIDHGFWWLFTGYQSQENIFGRWSVKKDGLDPPIEGEESIEQEIEWKRNNHIFTPYPIQPILTDISACTFVTTITNMCYIGPENLTLLPLKEVFPHDEKLSALFTFKNLIPGPNFDWGPHCLFEKIHVVAGWHNLFEKWYKNPYKRDNSLSLFKLAALATTDRELARLESVNQNLGGGLRMAAKFQKLYFIYAQ